MIHFFAHTFWGGFIVGVLGNLAASALLVVPTIVHHTNKLHERLDKHLNDDPSKTHTS